MVPLLSKISGEAARDVALLGKYSGILVKVAAALTVFWNAFSWVRKKAKHRRDLKILRDRVGSGLYTRDDILRALDSYIEPDCQSVDPSGGEDFRRVFSAREPAFKALDKLFHEGSSEKYTIILADSGMGKTTLLLNYYARHYRRKEPAFKLAIVPLGSRSATTEIGKVESRSETVLFLDAFDEDTLAIQDHRERLVRLLDLTNEFRHVLITCRTQFFEKADEIPRETGLMRVGATSAGQSREFIFQKLYLSPFSEEQVKSYLSRRFPLWRIGRRWQANAIAAKTPDLTARPMLLAHIQDLLDSKTPCTYAVQIYESMIRAWLLREEPFVSKSTLRAFSEALAVDIYTKREERGSERIHPSEAAKLASRLGMPLKAWQIRGRSLLNIDADGNLKFAHRSILEYLFVVKFIEGLPTTANQIWTDQIKKFWWEKIACVYRGCDINGASPVDLKEMQQLIDNGLIKGDLNGIELLSLSPLVGLSDSPRVHSDLNALSEFMRTHTYQNQTSQRRAKNIPGLFQNFLVGDPTLEEGGTGCIIDFVTGLMWQSNCTDQITFDEAIELARKNDEYPIAGLNGWRIPTLEEAISLLPSLITYSDGHQHGSPLGLLERWEDSIWTTDRIKKGMVGLACRYDGRPTAAPYELASLRFVRKV